MFIFKFNCSYKSWSYLKVSSDIHDMVNSIQCGDCVIIENLRL